MCMIFPRSSTICRKGTIFTPSIIGSSSVAVLPAQVGVELAGIQQMTQPFEPGESLIDESVAYQTHGLECGIELLGPCGRAPVELESRHQSSKLAEISLVSALI